MRRLIILLAILTFISCRKENQSPSCIIMLPPHKSEFSLGDTISVEISAEDPEGNLENLQLNFNGTRVALLSNPPFQYELHSSGYQPGDYTLQATVKDEGGLEGRDEIQVSFIAVLPTVITTGPDSVTSDMALVGGEVSFNGGSPVSARGVCWSTIQNPSLNGNHTEEGSGTGAFVSRISGLLCETDYFARAYAVNAMGTAYGPQVSFHTSICYGLPVVTTHEISDLTHSSVVCGGKIMDSGGAHIRSAGVCWSLSSSPTIVDNHTVDQVIDGVFTSSITGLSCNTVYYLRAFASSISGTSYGNQVSFVTDYCPDTLPSISTSPVTKISRSTAQSGGTITSDGGDPVSARGVCWSLAPNPTLADNFTSNGSGIGSFTSTLSDLKCYTTYYIRAYASNKIGTSFGDELIFVSGDCEVPTVETTPAGNITGSGASLGGFITSDGGKEISGRGIYYDTLPQVQIAGIKLELGTGSGSFDTTLNELSPLTRYYFRAYASNSVGTSFGTELQFGTSSPPQIPDVRTLSVLSQTDVSVLIENAVFDDGGSEISDRGICWSTSEYPDLSDYHMSSGIVGGQIFTATISDLIPNTTYYVRAYAENGIGIAYGNQISFKTYLSTMVDYDGNTYYTVEIGTQIWMATNLKATHYQDGTALTLIADSASWKTIGNSGRAYCWYNNESSNGETYGALYSWAAATNDESSTGAVGVQGICPSGWHIGSDDEWKTLERYIGMSQIAVDEWYARGTSEGQKLKSPKGWSESGNGNNQTGFSAIPGGYRFRAANLDRVVFYGVGTSATFWTSTGIPDGFAISRELRSADGTITRFGQERIGGFSVRCIKDD